MALKNIYFDDWQEYEKFIESQKQLIEQAKAKSMAQSLNVSDKLYEESVNK